MCNNEKDYKIIVALFIAVVVIAGASFLLNNASGLETTNDFYDYEGRFITVEHQSGYSILIDVLTRVSYLKHGSGITVLLDMEGKPLLYDGVLPR